MIYLDEIPTGTQGYLVEFTLRDSTTGQGKPSLAAGVVTCSYVRQGGAGEVVVTPDGTMTAGTWKTGGWADLGRGRYQFGVPNAALLAGANYVTLFFQASGVIDQDLLVRLSGAVDYRAATLPVDLQTIKTQSVTASGGVVFPAGTLVSVGTGAGQVNPSGGKVPATLAAGDVTGNLPGNVLQVGGVTASLASLPMQANLVELNGAPFTNVPAVVNAYASGQDPATLVLDATAASHNAANSVGHNINSGASVGLVTLADGGITQASFADGVKVPASLAAGDVTGNLPANLVQWGGSALPSAAAKVPATLAAGDVTGSLPVDLGATAPAGWVNAAAVAAGAFNGKGDWLPASSYTAPDTANPAAAVALLNGLTDAGDRTRLTSHALALAPAGSGGSVTVSAYASGLSPAEQLAAAGYTTARAGKLDALDAAVTTRLAASAYTAPANPSDYARNNAAPSWYAAPPTAAALATAVLTTTTAGDFAVANSPGSWLYGWRSTETVVTVAGATSAAVFQLTGSSADDGAYAGQEFGFRTGALRGQRRPVQSYVGATRTLTVASPFTAAPTAGDTGVVI